MLCPICKHEFSQPGPGEENHFPFCSDRCKLIDLGRWLSGKYQIPVVEEDESDNTETDPPNPLH